MNNAQYIDCELLEEKIQKSGLKIDFIVENLGLSRQGFAKKRKGITPFRVSEIFVLCSLLSITDDEEKKKIFYPKS